MHPPLWSSWMEAEWTVSTLSVAHLVVFVCLHQGFGLEGTESQFIGECSWQTLSKRDKMGRVLWREPSGADTQSHTGQGTGLGGCWECAQPLTTTQMSSSELTTIAVLMSGCQHLYFFLCHLPTQCDKDLPDFRARDGAILFLVEHPKSFHIILGLRHNPKTRHPSPNFWPQSAAWAGSVQSPVPSHSSHHSWDYPGHEAHLAQGPRHVPTLAVRTLPSPVQSNGWKSFLNSAIWFSVKLHVRLLSSAQLQARMCHLPWRTTAQRPIIKDYMLETLGYRFLMVLLKELRPYQQA